MPAPANSKRFLALAASVAIALGSLWVCYTFESRLFIFLLGAAAFLVSSAVAALSIPTIQRTVRRVLLGNTKPPSRKIQDAFEARMRTEFIEARNRIRKDMLIRDEELTAKFRADLAAMKKELQLPNAFEKELKHQFKLLKVDLVRPMEDVRLSRIEVNRLITGLAAAIEASLDSESADKSSSKTKTK
jgi:hypothetical protein